MPTPLEKEILKDIRDLLEQILRILALQVAADRSVTEGVWLLKLAGLDNRTIAEVLNTTTPTVRTLASNIRRTRPSLRRRVAES